MNNKRIRIGRKVTGFMCGSFGCLPIYGGVEQLPEKVIYKQKTTKELINEAIKEIEAVNIGIK